MFYINIYCAVQVDSQSPGEGALLALNGSPLGWGSDIGKTSPFPRVMMFKSSCRNIAGSIRIPCAFDNLYGFRPSSGRLPASGMGTSVSVCANIAGSQRAEEQQLPGLPTLGSVVGPMALDLPTVEMAMKVMLESFPWKNDCDVIEMPWRQEKIQSVRSRMSRRGEKDGNLVFAIMRDDGKVRPHPPIQRALTLVKEALLSQGYEVSMTASRLVKILMQSFRSLIGILHLITMQSKFL